MASSAIRKWYTYLVLFYLGLRILYAIYPITSSITVAVFGIGYIIMFGASAYLILQDDNRGALLAIAIGVLSIISIFIGFGYNNMNIPYNVIFIALSILEYKRLSGSPII